VISKPRLNKNSNAPSGISFIYCRVFSLDADRTAACAVALAVQRMHSMPAMSFMRMARNSPYMHSSTALHNRKPLTYLQLR